MSLRNDHEGTVITVVGEIDPEDLGITQPHEHLLSDLSVYFGEPAENSQRSIAYQPVSWDNIRWVKYHIRHNLDAAKQLDEKVALEELMLFKTHGGESIVDQTSIGLGRDPRALARISRIAGVNIIMGTGHYVTSPNDTVMDSRTADDLAEEIITDVKIGVGGSTPFATGIRAGIIGEVGCSSPLRDNERKALIAAALAQQETGLSISVHPGRNENAPLESVEVLRQARANLERVIICHMDRCGYLLETRLKLLDAGCYIEYDLFGTEGWYPADACLADGRLPEMPNDVGRLKQISELIEKGYLDKILMSHDICYKIMQARWGGPGYAHIIENVVPIMPIYGYTPEQIHALTVENPKSVLTINK